MNRINILNLVRFVIFYCIGKIPQEFTSQRALPAGCYQTMGYCGGWDLNMKCPLDETAEFCHVYKCEKCTSN